MRCASCRTTFFAEAEPETDELIYDAPEIEDDAADAAAGLGQNDIDAAFAMAEAMEGGKDDEDPDGPDLVVDAQSRRSRPSVAAARGKIGAKGASVLAGLRARLRPAPIAAAVVVLALAGVLVARESVVRAVPSTAGLFRMVGLEVNLAGVAIAEVVSTRFEEGGQRVLEVQGVLVNVTGEARPVAPLAFSLRDATHTALYSWTVEPPRGDLAPGESAPFRARLVAPPAEARQVLVRFAPVSQATVAGTSP
ncbi:hypothetical protein GCM10011322_09880 [Salinarimonas ramus]|uniref:DUF3426 domain-containing protein n=1 Tax=Salinarimonas ramus TaxID=690164 RepID=A0A917Q543_9HYPH|nr:hypothetical protein GCM10011322_09880 [Salinarimonas ramus]